MARNRPIVTLERLETAASILRPIEREVLDLSVREHLSSEEIAARLGISSRAADRLLAKALCSLDRAIERQQRPWGGSGEGACLMRWALWRSGAGIPAALLAAASRWRTPLRRRREP